MKFSNGANMRRHKQRHTGVKVSHDCFKYDIYDCLHYYYYYYYSFSHMNVEFVKRDSLGKTIWRNILQHTQKPYHIIVQFVIVAFSDKLQCVLTSRMSM